MKHSKPTVNRILLKSIPINRKIKGYWTRKYLRIAQNCGIEEAQRKMKHLRVTILSYIADENRSLNLDNYVKSSGFRRNGNLLRLFQYADTQPHLVLNYLKLYSGHTKSTQSVDDAAFSTKQRLDNVRSSDKVPQAMLTWLDVLSLSSRDKAKYYYEAKQKQIMFSHYCRHHTLQEWMAYWKKWYSLCRKGLTSACKADDKLVFPEVYKDFDVTSQASEAYSADFADLVSLHQNDYDPPLNKEELDFIDGFLHEEIQNQLYEVLWGETPGYSGLFKHTSILSGTYVGHVHHIRKKGGGTELRDIAVPNRFIQMALSPGAARLYNLVAQFPCDATFNQNKFDTKIQNRVNNVNLYQGSVDLSKATDNLPLSWGETCVQSLINIFGLSSDEERRSIELFSTVARANWEDQGYLINWNVGQPLGSLPSFAMLAITHNFFIESLALSQGLGHSPYVILGDDIVIFNRKLRVAYIRALTRRRIPLSLHKSFSGRLSEFAGKTYIKNCVPFYCSDHNAITWNSLFDWQATTGIRIPWSNLPREIRKRIIKLVKSYDANLDGSINPMKMASMAYSQAQQCIVFGRGSIQFANEQMIGNPEIFFEEVWSSEKELPDPVYHTGITLIGDGHPVVLMNERYAEKHGYFQRFRPVVLPQWYKDKVRPCATDIAIRAGYKACLELFKL